MTLREAQKQDVKITNKREYTHLKNKVGVIDYTKSYTIKTTSDTGNRLKMLLSSGFEVLYNLLEEKFYAIKLSEDRKKVLYSFTSSSFFDLYDLVNDRNKNHDTTGS